MKTQKKTNDQVIVLWSNQNIIHEMEVKLNELLPLAERLAVEYFKLPFCKLDASIGHILSQSSSEAKAHFLNLIPDSIEMGTLRIDKIAAIKSGLFAQPTFLEFEQVLNIANETNLQQMSPFFKIEDGLCILNPSTWDTFVKGQSITASTPDELELYELWRNFLDSVQGFDEYLRKNCDYILRDGLSLIQLSRLATQNNEAKLMVNPQVFAALAKRMSINPKNNKS